MIITIGRKPFVGTVVGTVKDTHCGAINVDASRIKFETDGSRKITKRTPRDDEAVWTDKNSGMKKENSLYADADPRGRFPANVVLSSSVVEMLDEQSLKGGMHSASHAKPHDTNRSNGVVTFFGGDNPLTNGGRYGDSGGASRYFKVIK